MSNRTGLSPVQALPPQANETIVLYDDGGKDTNVSNTMRVDAVLGFDQAVTITQLFADAQGDLHVAQTWSYPVAGTVGVKRTYTLTCVAKANLANNGYFTLTPKSGTAVVFEYKVDVNFIAVTDRVTIDVSAATDAQSVYVATRAAINNVMTDVVAGAGTGGVGTLTARRMGTEKSFTATENVADAGFTIVSGAAAVDAELLALSVKKLPGRNVLRVTAGATPPTDYFVGIETNEDSAVSQ